MRDYDFRTIEHFRELGGLPAGEGKTIRHGFLFRSGDLSRVSAEEREKLADLGIVRVFDLRDREETERSPDLPGRYEIVPVPSKPRTVSRRDRLFAGGDFFDRFYAMTEGQYNYFLHDFAATYFDVPHYRDCVSVVLKGLNDHQPLLVHCFSGKDRTGVLSMILAAALGCSYETCKGDYLRHNRYVEEELAGYNALLDGKNATEWGRKAYIKCNSVSADWFDCAWYSIFNSYRSIDEYLTEEMGITLGEIADWREFYLE